MEFVLQNKINSFTSAGIFPIKVLQDRDCISREKKIVPRHVQLIITNDCNLKCNFCSCSKRDIGKEMNLEVVIKVMEEYCGLGCMSVTITGGGEPLLHKDINNILFYISNLGIKIGLVTNGLCLSKLTTSSLNRIDWISISFDDNREFKKLEKVFQDIDFSILDWSFSYVLSSNPNYKNLKDVIEFANRKEFTHVRIVTDLLDLSNVPDMLSVRNQIQDMGIDDSLVIYQGRKKFTKGKKRCLISLLKPVVDVDGSLYPCCGSQYAMQKPSYQYNGDMRMGGIEEIMDIFDKQRYFDGSACVKCYYDNYNYLLEGMIEDVEHREFL